METLKNSREFNPIYNKGVKVYTKYTIIFVYKTNEQKFGFVTSKKVGNAVARNRLRRIMREVVRLNITKFRSNHSYILVANKNCLEDYSKLNYEVLKKDIMTGIKRYEKNNS